MSCLWETQTRRYSLPFPTTVWEVPGGVIELRNPSWRTLVDSILGDVSHKLGVEASGKGIISKIFARS